MWPRLSVFAQRLKGPQRAGWKEEEEKKKERERELEKGLKDKREGRRTELWKKRGTRKEKCMVKESRFWFKILC